MKLLIIVPALCFSFLSRPAVAQQSAVNWTAFGALDDSLRQEVKPVMLYFNTEWCTYCRKMEKRVFTKRGIADVLNERYYAVKMDAETTDTIYFEGQAFVNGNAGNQSRGIHELAQLFSRETGFVAPTLIVLDKDFRVKEARYEYLHSAQLRELLR